MAPVDVSTPFAKINGQWLVLAAAVLWGTTGTAQALAPVEAEPIAIGAMRLIVGGVALMIVAIARGAFPSQREWPKWPTTLAAVSMAAYQLFFFAAVTRTGVVVGTIVAIGSAPILTGMLGVLLQFEQPTRRWILATGMTIVGCGMLISNGNTITIDVIGIFLALGAGGAYAVYAVASKRLLAIHSPDAVIAIVFFIGALLLLPTLWVVDLKWLAQPRGIAIVLHLGVIATAISYTLFAQGLRSIPVSTAVTLSLSEPLTAGVLGIFLLGERLSLVASAGIGLLLTGLALLTLGKGSRMMDRTI